MQCAIACGHNETRLQLSVHINNSFPLVKIIFNLICLKGKKELLTTKTDDSWKMRRFQLLYEMWHLACNFVILAQLMDIKLDLHIPNRNAEKLVTRHNKRYCERRKCYMKYGVWNEMKIWSSHLLDNLNNCLMNLINSGDSTGFGPMTSAMAVQCSNQLSYEVTQLRAGQFVGLMFSRERNVVWKKCYMKCGVWNQMKIWSSHLLDNLSNCLGIRTHDLCDASAVL